VCDTRVIATAIGIALTHCRTSRKGACQDKGEAERPCVKWFNVAHFNLLGTRVMFANDLHVADIQSTRADALSDWLCPQ
jgi:hypothetical protein